MIHEPHIIEIDVELQRVLVVAGDQREWLTKDDLLRICGRWDSVSCTAWHRLAGKEYTCP